MADDPTTTADPRTLDFTTRITARARILDIPEITRAVRKQHAIDKAAVRRVLNSGQAYPYGSVREWLQSRRLASLWADQGGLSPEAVKVIVENRNTAQADEIQKQTEKLFKLSQWDEWSKTALQAGLIATGIGAGVGASIGLIAVGVGAAAGSVVPVLGTLIGAAVGFIVGIATAIIPVEKWKVMDNFAGLARALGVVDRYILWGACKRVQNNARALEKRDALPPWWLKTPDFYTIWGGIDSVTVFMYEELARQDCFSGLVPGGGPSRLAPTNFAAWDKVALYAAAVTASHGAENERLRDTQFYRNTVNEQKGSKAMVPWLEPLADLPCKAVREAAVSQGLDDFNSVPITDAIVDAMEQREAALSGVQ